MQPVHEIAGYTFAGLVGFCLLGDLVGSRYACCTRFLKGPGTALAWRGEMTQGRERHHLGHNPVGAVMILAMLVALSGISFTGWRMEEPGRAALLPDLPQIVAPARTDEDGGATARPKVLEEVAGLFAGISLIRHLA